MKRTFLWVCTFVIAVTSLTAIVPPQQANASFFNRGEYRGYFYNKKVTSGARVWNDGIHINLSGSGRTDVDRFMSILQRKYRGGTQDRVGAAFIYNTMVGRAAPGTGTSVSAAEWDALHERLYAFVDNGGTLTRRSSYYYRTNSFYQRSAQDVAWYDERGSMPAYVFARGGTEYYVIKEICANPLGGIGIPLSGWTVGGLTTVNRTTASPGQTVQFKYYLRNTGSASLTKNISWDASRVTPGGTRSASVERGTLTSRLGPNSAWRQTATENYTIPPKAADGQVYCRAIYWSPLSSTSNTIGRSALACVTVVVPPSADATSDYLGGAFMNVEENGTWNHILDLNGFNPRGEGSVARIEYDVFQSIDGKETSLVDPPDGARTFKTDYTGRLQDVGLEICHYFNYRVFVIRNGVAVRTLTGSSKGRSSSGKGQCVTVAKRPTVQVWGNDLRVGSGFSNPAVTGTGAGVQAAQYNLNGQIKGSWAEYSIIAPTRVPKAKKSISRIGSGSAYNGAIPMGSTAASWSKLTFSNTTPNATGNYTAYPQMGNAPDVTGYFTSGHISSRLTLVNPAPGNIDGYRPNTVLVSKGIVNITKDIVNGSTASDPRGITQMVIIANDIRIQPNVKRVDAWLIAPNGTVNTCPGAPSKMTMDNCPELLQINGPIMATNLIMKRTGGVMNGAPAELFNLRGDAYVWARGVSEDAGVWHTVNLRELPPRY